MSEAMVMAAMAQQGVWHVQHRLLTMCSPSSWTSSWTPRWQSGLQK